LTQSTSASCFAPLEPGSFIPISTRSAPMVNQAEVNHPLSGNIAHTDQDSFKISGLGCSVVEGFGAQALCLFTLAVDRHTDQQR
jgi:hypothetical protein